MLAHSSQADHRQRVDGLVRRWLDERKTLITQEQSLHAALAAGADAALLARHLAAFCQTLMDYVSAGHFEVYDELLDEAERRQALPAAAGQALMARLQTTTDAAIRFNELCEDPHSAAAQACLARELPILRLELESRFQTEDRLLALLHESRESPPA